MKHLKARNRHGMCFDLASRRFTVTDSRRKAFDDKARALQDNGGAHRAICS